MRHPYDDIRSTSPMAMMIDPDAEALSNDRPYRSMDPMRPERREVKAKPGYDVTGLAISSRNAKDDDVWLRWVEFKDGVMRMLETGCLADYFASDQWKADNAKYQNQLSGVGINALYRSSLGTDPYIGWAKNAVKQRP
jgi:hypothetical protein